MQVFQVPETMQYVGTVVFTLAVLHTFMVKHFNNLAHRFEEGSFAENAFHFLGEVEVVFGIWSAVFFLIYTILYSFAEYDESHHHVIGGALGYLETRNFTEPAFVFVIMCVAGTRPIIIVAQKLIGWAASLMPLERKMGFYISTMIVGPLLGSFITEPAAMTLTALILLENYYGPEYSTKFKYATLGLLFVNISVGGTLTHFAAPPVLMVASKYGWDILFMIQNFGSKATLAIIIGTLITAYWFRSELRGGLRIKEGKDMAKNPPLWVIGVHLLTLALVVYTSHHMVFFMGLFLFFLGFVAASQEYQDVLKLKESLLVGFFLGGLVILGGVQGWWLKPLISGLGDFTLFLGATGLTAITDNAALTYLGTLVDLTDSQKYNLVAGAVTGGGLTVIANAPNPAGFGILKDSFGHAGISPIGLFRAALFPTFLCMIAFQIFS
jgi:predicted cation transporter